MGENSVDAVVCDPPYALGFMGKAWDRFPTDKGPKKPFANQSREAKLGGHPFQEWCQTWAAECLRVAKPGAYLLAFGGTRTFHRLACAIEDAGWILKDTLSWNYGSGFPKSHDISKGLDKRRRRDFVKAAIELGLIVPGNSLHDWTKAEHSPSDAWWEKFKAKLNQEQWESIERKVAGYNNRRAGWFHSQNGHSITAPATPEAKQWDGWGTALKPAWEPIILAQAPLEGTYAQNILKWGCGALNISACRIGADKVQINKLEKWSGFGQEKRPDYTPTQSQGRWPANFLLSHSSECIEEKAYIGHLGEHPRLLLEREDYPPADDLEKTTVWRCVPDCPVAILDGQSGESKDGKIKPYKEKALNPSSFDFTGRQKPAFDYGGQGGASRFFYCAKASRSERNAGLEELEDKIQHRMRPDKGQATGLNTDPRWGPKISKNNHPTVKPIKLLRYLCRLVTPPNGKILDPFTGSGSTGCAAVLEGFEFIGIEKEKEYVEIARARIAHFSAGKA
jgi:DNA modification methylase